MGNLLFVKNLNKVITVPEDYYYSLIIGQIV